MDIQNKIREQVKRLALELQVVGLLNVQFAIKGQDIYILEVNPRASRTVPFIAKAAGISLAKIAARCMAGESLAKQNALAEIIPPYFAVKKPVFPFNKFAGVDPILGPEMRSTGEAMGIAESFGQAFGKAQMGAGDPLPRGGVAFVSVRDADKPKVAAVARTLRQFGFAIVSTDGTAAVLKQAEIPCRIVNKVTQGRPHIVDMIKNDEISFIINTTEGEQAIEDSFSIRRSAISHKVCYTTTLAGGVAACLALKQKPSDEVHSLQELHSLKTSLECE